MTFIANDAAFRMGDLDRCQGDLDPLEKKLATGVSKSRLRELQAGRTLARLALTELGEECSPVLMGGNGEPLWANNVCGSISHTHRHVSVLVARKRTYESVGIDIDDDRSLGPDVLAEIAVPEERDAVQSAAAHLPVRQWGSLVFSAKEALFKCQCPVTGFVDLQFSDVKLVFDRSRGVVRGEKNGDRADAVRAILQRIELYFLSEQGAVIAYALLRRSAG